ncbi:MAG: 5-(carboxyamino)imidazole ribonucleotide synthase [Bacteroidota bacterium]
MKTIGILGGGQLGKMTCHAAADWHWPVHILDKSRDFPAAPYATHFVEGDFRRSEDVLAFGRSVDVLTIEIESVNTEALHQLVAEGKEVYPQPHVIDLIKDKGTQKEFLAKHELATSPFELCDQSRLISLQEKLRDFDLLETSPPAEVQEKVANGEWTFPFVQKARTGGYDGRGVHIVRSEKDLENLLPGPCLIEKMADIDKELAVVVARDANGQIRAFPCVEMVFHPTANLLEYQLCPARINGDTQDRATDLAIRTAEAFGIVGLLAVELFLNKDGSIWVNEVAPRPHNSGHHTIEACVTSQYQQLLRILTGLPMGDTDMRHPSAMANVLGAEGHTGPTHYDGLDGVMGSPAVFMHLYGKTTTKPFRKMGHLTALGDTLEQAEERVKAARDSLRVITR